MFWPSAPPVLPVIVWSTAASAAFRKAPKGSGSNVTVGAVVSTGTSRLTGSAGLPMAFVTVAVTVTSAPSLIWPPAWAGVRSTLQPPPA